VKPHTNPSGTPHFSPTSSGSPGRLRARFHDANEDGDAARLALTDLAPHDDYPGTIPALAVVGPVATTPRSARPDRQLWRVVECAAEVGHRPQGCLGVVRV
jgi:hypothetical protein